MGVMTFLMLCLFFWSLVWFILVVGINLKSMEETSFKDRFAMGIVSIFCGGTAWLLLDYIVADIKVIIGG